MGRPRAAFPLLAVGLACVALGVNGSRTFLHVGVAFLVLAAISFTRGAADPPGLRFNMRHRRIRAARHLLIAGFSVSALGVVAGSRTLTLLGLAVVLVGLSLLRPPRGG